MAISGKHVLLKVNAGSKSVPRMVVVAEQDNCTISETRSSQSVSHKDSNTDVAITGNKSVSIDLSGFRVRSDEGLVALQRAFDSDQEVLARISDFGTEIEEYTCKVTAFSRAFPVGGAQTYNATLVPTQDKIILA